MKPFTRKHAIAPGLLLLLFAGLASLRIAQTVGQDELLHYVRLGDDLYRDGFSRAGELITFSPHLYGFAIWLSHVVFGPGVVAARVPGILSWALALWMVWHWGMTRACERGKENEWGWPLAFLAVGALMPLSIQGSVFIDIDNGFLVPLVFFQCWCVDRLTEERSWWNRGLVCFGTMLALWGRLTTPMIIMPLLVAYAGFRNGWRVSVDIGIALITGAVAFLGTWWLYCTVTGVVFMGPFAYLYESFQTTTVGSRGATLQKVFLTGILLWFWLGSGCIALWGTVGWMRGSEWVRQRKWERDDLFLGVGLFLLAGYSVVGGALFGFPKYHSPAIPLMLAGCAGTMVRQGVPDIRRFVPTLLGFALCAFLVQVALIRDPILLIRLDLRRALIFQELPVRPVLVQLGIRLLLGLGLACIPLLLFRRGRHVVIAGLVAITLGMNIGFVVLQSVGRYQTGYNYGDRGDVKRVAERLRDVLGPNSQAIAPGEVVYLLDHPGVSHVPNERWTDVVQLLQDLQAPDMEAVTISIITNSAEQVLTLTRNPEIRAVLDREYTRSDMGEYILFLRKHEEGDPAPTPIPASTIPVPFSSGSNRANAQE